MMIPAIMMLGLPQARRNSQRRFLFFGSLFCIVQVTRAMDHGRTATWAILERPDGDVPPGYRQTNNWDTTHLVIPEDWIESDCGSSVGVPGGIQCSFYALEERLVSDRPSAPFHALTLEERLVSDRPPTPEPVGRLVYAFTKGAQPPPPLSALMTLKPEKGVAGDEAKIICSTPREQSKFAIPKKATTATTATTATEDVLRFRIWAPSDVTGDSDSVHVFKIDDVPSLRSWRSAGTFQSTTSTTTTTTNQRGPPSELTLPGLSVLLSKMKALVDRRDGSDTSRLDTIFKFDNSVDRR